MDKQFIQMVNCEIQEDWKPKVGDWTYRKSDGKKQIITDVFKTKGKNVYRLSADKDMEDYRLKEYYIYLPSIEQLQDMLIGRLWSSKPNHLLDAVHWMYTGNKNFHRTKDEKEKERIWKYYSKFKTRKQFWTAIVMWELYNKYWSINKWV